MITRDTQVFLAALGNGTVAADSAAVPKAVFMVEPVNFRLSNDAALDNSYMDVGSAVDPDRALEQYLELIQIIRDAGVPVKSFPGDPLTPDNVFPNNAFATIPGRFIIGHMFHASRQLETSRKDIRAYFQDRGYESIDLSVQDCVAELTGPLIIDRARRVGFCGMSDRVNQAGVKAMHQAFKLRHTLQFDLKQGEYHTNVVMSVLASHACVLHAESVASAALPMVLANIYGGRVLHLDKGEKDAFAGNCICLTQHDVFMSEAAADGLRPGNHALLESWGFRIHVAELDEIEKAGGSLRCMVAEIY